MESPSITYVTHDRPARRPERAYVAMADLAPFGLEGQQEQLWFDPLPDGGFELACIPFCVYGLALGDRVALAGDRFVGSVVSRSGRRVFRVFFTEPRPPAGTPDARGALREAITTGASWRSGRAIGTSRSTSRKGPKPGRCGQPCRKRSPRRRLTGSGPTRNRSAPERARA